MKHAERWKLYGRIITNQGGQAISGLVPSRMHTHVFDLVVNAPRIADEHAELLAALKQCLAELEAYDLPRDPLDPQRVAVKSARAAIAKAQPND